MFCGKCGTKNVDQADFCAGCGARLGESKTEKNILYTDMNLSNKDRKVGMVAVSVVVAVVVIVGFLLFGGRSYKKTVYQFVDAQFEADAAAIVNLIPTEMLDFILKEEDALEEEFIKEGDEELQEQLDSIEKYLGDDWEVSYEISDTEDLSKEDLEDLRNKYEDIDIKISAAKKVGVELTVKAEDMENSNTQYVSVIKVGRSWYLDLESMGNLF